MASTIVKNAAQQGLPPGYSTKAGVGTINLTFLLS